MAGMRMSNSRALRRREKSETVSVRRCELSWRQKSICSKNHQFSEKSADFRKKCRFRKISKSATSQLHTRWPGCECLAAAPCVIGRFLRLCLCDVASFPSGRNPLVEKTINFQKKSADFVEKCRFLEILWLVKLITSTNATDTRKEHCEAAGKKEKMSLLSTRRHGAS